LQGPGQKKWEINLKLMLLEAIAGQGASSADYASKSSALPALLANED
jgi:hypothetical protein